MSEIKWKDDSSEGHLNTKWGNLEIPKSRFKGENLQNSWEPLRNFGSRKLFITRDTFYKKVWPNLKKNTFQDIIFINFDWNLFCVFLNHLLLNLKCDNIYSLFPNLLRKNMISIQAGSRDPKNKRFFSSESKQNSAIIYFCAFVQRDGKIERNHKFVWSSLKDYWCWWKNETSRVVYDKPNERCANKSNRWKYYYKYNVNKTLFYPEPLFRIEAREKKT